MAPSKAADSSDSSSNTGRTWGIVGGVVGGVVLVVAIVFVVWRLTQRRFSSLDEVEDDIKWPELNPEGTETSTINPLGTHPTGRAGVGDDGDDNESMDGKHNRSGSGSMLAGTHTRQASYEQLGMTDSQGHYASTGPNYDPYLGASAAPFPAPQNIYPPPPASYHHQQQQQYGQQQQQHHYIGGSPAPTYSSLSQEYQESLAARSGSQYGSNDDHRQRVGGGGGGGTEGEYATSADLYRGDSVRSAYSTDTNAFGGFAPMPGGQHQDPFAASPSPRAGSRATSPAMDGRGGNGGGFGPL